VLVELLCHATQRGETDFGAHIMPALPATGAHVLAYDFAGNELPGVKPYEDRMYWRDVGTLAALAQARADVEGDFPHFDLRNREWPIRRDLLAAPPRRLPTPSSKRDRIAANTPRTPTSPKRRDIPSYSASHR
jgi:glucose-1-phosphate adenylyltransferase